MFKKSKENNKITIFYKEFIILLKEVFLNIFFLYKNFFHWNGSKILIKFFSILLGLILSLPFLFIVVLFCIIDPIEWLDIIDALTSDKNLSLKLISTITVYPFYVIIELFFTIIAFIFFFFGIFYSLPLEANLYLNYLDSKKLGFFSNYYFNINLIKKYILIISRIIGYLFIPIIIFLLVFLIFIILMKIFGIYYLQESISFRIFTYFLFILFIFCIFLFVYISYRVNFSYMILVDSKKYKDTKKSKFYVKESIKLTKGSVFMKFLLLIILFSVILLPFDFIDSNLSKKGLDMKDYLGYKYSLLDLSKDTNKNHYDFLKLRYETQTDEEIRKKIIYNNIWRNLFYIFSFLFLSGLINMALVSFYKIELLNKKKSILNKLNFKK